jgi:lipoprotein-releasing system permease protein
MNYSLLFKISKTHLLSRIKQPIIAGLGVTFGIGTFIILVSFMTGLNGLLDGLVLNRTPHIHLYKEIKKSNIQPIERIFSGKEKLLFVNSVKPKEEQLSIHNAIPLMKELKENPEVLGCSPQVVVQVFYLAGSIAINGRANGTDIREEIKLFNFKDYIIEGDPYELEKETNTIILGAGLAKKLIVNIGDRIQISTPQGDVFSVKVVAFYQSGLAEIDDIQSFVNLNFGQILLNKSKNFITDIHVKLYDMAKAPALARLLEENYNLTATDIQTANAQFETGTAIRNIITYAVSITLLIVAGFGIYNILNMLIYEKMNDIAILKATGFTGKDVQVIFIIQSMIIGICGGALGLILGYFFSVFIDELPFETDALPTIHTYPVNFNPIYYVIGIVFALVATFFAGYLPSRKAKKVDPVEILRGQ